MPFVRTHVKIKSYAFYKKMIELGGEQAYKLDQNLYKEGKWLYLKF